MSVLSNLFEEDIDLQDSLEDIQTIPDDTEDMIIGAIEDRYSEEENNPHLFTNRSSQINDDGLTPEEENEINVALLNAEDTEVFGTDDDIDPDDIM